MANIHLIITMD